MADDAMLRSILVAVDGSAYSGWAADAALALAADFGARITGIHVYAARLHERRFRDMEPGLPEEYREPAVLARQREVHGTLIEKGLRLISDSYLGALERRCLDAGIAFTGKTPEGKNYAELVRDIAQDAYDLLVVGARGTGEVWRRGERRDHVLGSVCERLARRVRRDLLVVKDARPLAGTFVVGVDGSARGFGALRLALALAARTGARVQAVAAYDPFLHKTVFTQLEHVLTEDARRVFDSEAQRRLHDELVDGGIARLYEGHLEEARRLAAGMGAEIETRLLAGRAWEAMLRHVAESRPALLALGRTGLHADEGLDIGGNAETLLRLAPCHVLLAAGTLEALGPPAASEVPDALPWTEEALARLERVPEFVRGMVRRAVEAHARRRGLAAVDARVVEEARATFRG